MIRKGRGCGGFLPGAALAVVFILCLFGTVFAGVSLDGSPVAHGRTDTLSGPAYIIDADMGTQKGANLFHSLRTFNIGTGEFALFTDTGATGAIQNIITRITGGSASLVDGGIASIVPGANLFLLNPYGFMFGPNAWIDVPGSFHVSTADYLRMADGAKFFTDLGKTSVLSTEPVAAFGFLTSTPASITFEGTKLFAYPSNTVSVIAGGIEMKGDPNNPGEPGRAWIASEGGQVNLAAVSSLGEVVLNPPGGTPSMDVSSFNAFGPITLSGHSIVDVKGPYTGETGAGTIIVRGGKLQMTTASFNAQTFGSVSANPVGIDIVLTGDMVMEQGSYISTETSRTGDAGAVLIKARNLAMREGATISTATFGAGRGGDITVNVENGLSLLPYSDISSNTVESGTGGNIAITARDIIVAGDQASIDASLGTDIAAATCGSGHGGSITIRTDSLNVLGGGSILTNLTPYNVFPTVASGQGGNIDIAAKNINVSGMVIQNGTGTDYHSRIESRLLYPDATGMGGNISVTGESITLGAGGYIGSYLTYGSPGTAGNITVQAGTLTLNPQGKIESSSVLGTGTGARAGDITVNANNIIMTGVGPGSAEWINFTGLRSDTLDGTGGDITVKAGTLAMRNGARIITDSSGAGTGGDIGITSAAVQLGAGAVISAKSTASGYTGNIAINTGVLESHGSTISAEAAMTDGGNITVNAGGLVLLRDASRITTSVNGGPATTGGNINITSPNVVLDDSHVVANAYEGRGGNIRIVAGVFLASPESVVSASSRLGIDGTVDIRSPVTDISGTLVPVNGGFLQTAETVRDRCVARIKGSSQSSLTVSGRDGLPPRPGMVLPAPAF